MSIIFKKNWSIFIRAKRIVFAAVLELLVVIAVLAWTGSQITIHNGSTWYLNDIQKICAVIFTLNLYISYEYIHGIRTCGIEEAVETHRNGKIKLYATAYAVLAAFSVILFLLMTLFPFAIALMAKSNPALFVHILSVSLLNTLLPGLLACMAGLFFALKLKRTKAYALMVLIMFIMLPASNLLPGIANDGYHINVWPAKAFFSNVLPPNTDWTIDYQYGVSNEYFRWNLTGFWLLLFLALALYCILSQKTKQRVLATSLCIALSVVNLCFYGIGSSKIDLTESPTSVFRTDQVYYRNHEPREEEAEFRITSYDMKLDIDRVLNAKVTMELDAPPELTEYKFTLYNWYKVTSIKDEGGMDLPFVRDGDYITVNTGDPVKAITISFSGYSPMFYSNEQGVCLPGCFPYYPWAGYRKVYYCTPEDRPGLVSFIARTDLPETDFTVEISGGKNIQTNLNKEEADGSFHGKTNGLSVMGGFLEEKRIGPYNTVICTIDRPDIVMTEAFLDALQAEITAVEEKRGLETHIDLKQYKIFQTNETILNRASYGVAMSMNDHIFIAAFPEEIGYIAEEIVREWNDPPILSSAEKIALDNAQHGEDS